MRINKIIYRFLTIIISVTLCASCDVHQWPELKPPGIDNPKPDDPNDPNNPDDPDDPNNPDDPDDPNNPDDPDDPDTKSHILLRLHFEPDFYVWEHYYNPSSGSVNERYPDEGVDSNHPGTTDLYTNIASSGLMSIQIQVYQSTNINSSIIERTLIQDVTSGYDCDIDLELEPGTYNVAIWSHLLGHQEYPPFYNSQNFHHVYILAENYSGNTDYRDGFRGHETITVSPLTTSVTKSSIEEDEIIYTIPMKRPMGKFEIITTDLSEFLSRENSSKSVNDNVDISDYRVVISYPAYYPTGYSVMEDRLVNSSGGYSFETKMSVTGDGEASLGFDYVLINDIKDGGVQAQISVYDMSGNRVSSSSMLTIPIRRDHHTILRGEFLETNANGGVGIDPDYDGDHNITVSSIDIEFTQKRN